MAVFDRDAVCNDPAIERISATACTEFALGEDRQRTAVKMMAVALGMLARTDEGGSDATILAKRLLNVAEEQLRQKA